MEVLKAKPSMPWVTSAMARAVARRSAVVAFSADRVYALAELLRRQRGGAGHRVARIGVRDHYSFTTVEDTSSTASSRLFPMTQQGRQIGHNTSIIPIQ